MTVATFNQTDYTTQDSATYKANIDADMNVLAKLADAFAPHQSNAVGDMYVALDPGILTFPDGNNSTHSGGHILGPFSAPTGGNNRIDLITIPAGGMIAANIVAGTPAANPSPPECPAGNLPIAQVFLSTGMNAILNSNITDVRGWFAMGFPAIGNASHNMNTTGNQNIAIGFCPSAVFFLCGVESTGDNAWSAGFDNGSSRFCLYSQYALVAGKMVPTGTYAGMIQQSANNYSCFTIGAKNSSGITITWAKGGTPSGNALVGYLAVR